MPDIVTRSARTNSYDPATRTFEAIIATGNPVARGAGFEVIDPAGMDFPDSVPLQLDHRTSVRDTVGRASDFRIDGANIIARGRLSAAADADWLASRIEDGTVASLSVGFSVSSWREAADQSGRRTRTAARSRLHEVSFVSVPLDPNARIRSMPDDNLNIDDRVTRNRSRRTLCRSLGLPQAFEDEALDSPWDDAEFNRRALEQVAARTSTNVQTRQHNSETLDNPEVYRRAAAGALQSFITGTAAEGPATQLTALGWEGFHRDICRRNGFTTTGMDTAEIIARALTTSDMPMIAAPALNQSMRRTYEALLSPAGQLFAPRTIRDFNPHKEVLIDWTTLKMDKVGQLGEFKSAYVDESGESYQLFTIGGITGVSRQLWINGAGALANLSQQLGRRLAADVNDRRVAHITQGALAGPTMADGDPVFDAGRGNVGSLLTTSVATVITGVLQARASMPKRKGAGDVMVGVSPRFWLVPSEFEETAIKALASIQASTSSEVNALAGKLEIITEPRLTSTTTSYLAVEPTAMDGAVQASLAGAPGPHTESRWGFTTDAVEFKIRLDLGFGWPEWRSWTRLDHAAS